MILIEKTQIVGLEPTIRGMRNPMNSWEKSDSMTCAVLPEKLTVSGRCTGCKNEFDSHECYVVGSNDYELMQKLAAGGSVHAKYRRMIVVYVDITAPLYWWKEFDTYKVGTVANSCSSLYEWRLRPFEMKDFSTEQLAHNAFDCGGMIDVFSDGDGKELMAPIRIIEMTIEMLNAMREKFLETGDKRYWWQIVQLLPSTYHQKRTVMLNYEVLANIYQHRRNHKLDEWRKLCRWIEGLPYSDVITGNTNTEAIQ